jgi:hypothetical protein
MAEDSQGGDTALARRANAGLRKDLQQLQRIYDPEQETEWGLKYRNFSSDHMRRAYKTYAEARHDPFNKCPGWTQAVIRKIAKSMADIGISPEDEFAKLDVSGDGVLDRAEVRSMFMDFVPDLSDTEIIAVFDSIDHADKELVSLQELTQLFWGRPTGSGQHVTKGVMEARPLQTTASQMSDAEYSATHGTGGNHRTPVHRVKRIPPAQVEGWEHLRDVPASGRTA